MIIGIDASRTAIANRTGTEAYAYHLIHHLLPLTATHGHTVRLYFNQPPPNQLFPQQPNTEYRIIPFPRLWTHLRLGAELMLNRPDIFFTPAHVIPYTWRGKAMATIHDLGYEFFPEAHTPKQVRHLKWGTRHNAKQSTIILADSEATKRDLVDLYGTPAAKIEVVYPGVDPQFVAEAQSADKLVRDNPYLLFLSTIQPRKNVAAIVTAFAHIADQIPHDLLLAGQVGWRSAETLAVIDALPPLTKKRIHLLGFVPDSQKAGLIKGASAFLYPSLYEGFGFPLLEANVCGVPVIAANTSSLAELSATGGAIAINPQSHAELQNAILKVLNDAALRDQLITAGHENVKRFSWQQAAEKILNLMETCS